MESPMNAQMTQRQRQKLLAGVERVRHEGGYVEYRWTRDGLSSVVIQSVGDADRQAAEWRYDQLCRRR